MNVLISIGNSDDKLTQAEWSRFVKEVRNLIAERGYFVTHGEWFSLPDAQWQNANWCLQPAPGAPLDSVKANLRQVARIYGQDSIAWTQGEVEFLSPE
jgi:hypothetical protein